MSGTDRKEKNTERERWGGGGREGGEGGENRILQEDIR